MIRSKFVKKNDYLLSSDLRDGDTEAKLKEPYGDNGFLCLSMDTMIETGERRNKKYSTQQETASIRPRES